MPNGDPALNAATRAETNAAKEAPTDHAKCLPPKEAPVKIAAGEFKALQLLAYRMPTFYPLAAEAYLAAHPELTGARDLFRLNAGPIASTLDNRREPFFSVAPETAAKNVYPAGMTREAMDAFLAAHPERRDTLMDDRSVVIDATPQNRAHALMVLDHHPVLDALHPGLRQRLQAEQTYLAVPYSVAYAHDILFIADRFNAAADDVESGDAAFARYLRLRARDLLSDDYEGGDAA